MYDKERLAKIIADLERYLGDVDKLGVKTSNDLNHPAKFYSLSMLIFSLINRAIDLGDEIVSAKKLGMPEKYRDIFHLLLKNKIIGLEMEKAFSGLVHVRNLIAHEYQSFTEKEVYSAYQKLPVIKQFIVVIKKEIAKRG